MLFRSISHLKGTDKRMANPQQTPAKIDIALATLELWAVELHVLNNRKTDTDESAVRRLRDDFREGIYPSNYGPLSLRERASTIMFETFATTFGNMPPPSHEGTSKGGLVAAWKKNVARSLYRQTYQQFEQVIVDSIAKNGAHATLDKFPSFANAADVAATLDYLNLEAKNLPAGAVAALLRGVDQTRTTAPTRAAATP